MTTCLVNTCWELNLITALSYASVILRNSLAFVFLCHVVNRKYFLKFLKNSTIKKKKQYWGTLGNQECILLFDLLKAMFATVDAFPLGESPLKESQTEVRWHLILLYKHQPPFQFAQQPCSKHLGYHLNFSRENSVLKSHHPFYFYFKHFL